jgi:uncharacterized membrane protein
MNVTARSAASRPGAASHVAFAATMIGLGILGLVKRDFAATWGPVPDDAPGRTALIYLCALVSLLGGTGLLFRRYSAASVRVLLAFYVLWILAVRVPYFLFVSSAVDGWHSLSQSLVMTAAAWILFVAVATDRHRRRLGFLAAPGGVRVARALYGLALIPFGIAHFLFLEATAPLVPDWLPWHIAWAYITGATFVAAGVAILVGAWARLAAMLSVVQMGLFAILVWIPRAAAGTLSAFQWGEFVATVALTAAGWVVADSWRGVPWLAARGDAGRYKEGWAAA